MTLIDSTNELKRILSIHNTMLKIAYETGLKPPKDATVNIILQLISERERLARIDELNRIIDEAHFLYQVYLKITYLKTRIAELTNNKRSE